MIRQLREEDWATVNPWLLEIGKASFDPFVPETLQESVRRAWKSQPEGFVVADSGNRLEGLLWFSSDSPHKTAYLHAIYVIPSCRKNGIARDLLSYLEQYCHTTGLCAVELNVTAALKEAVGFYQKNGFAIARYAMRKAL